MDGLWLGVFALLCVGIGGLTWACGKAVPTAATTSAAPGASS